MTARRSHHRIDRPLLACLLLVASALAACAPASSPAAPSPPAEGSGAPAPQIVGPVILDPGATSATVPVGRFVVFSVPEPASWTLAAEPADLVALTPGTQSDTLVTNPGAEALAPGTATVTLTNAAGERLVFTITIE